MKDFVFSSADNSHRFLRYQMQSVAKYMLPNHRVGICLQHQIQKYGSVDVFKHRKTQRAFYGGLMVCGSVWTCPVCASKVSERRRLELKHASTTYRESGGHLTMLTLTFSHSRVDALVDLLNALGQAMLNFRSVRRYKRLCKDLRLFGSIRSFEITYGKNGWHPHIHLLNFHENEIEPWEFIDYEDRFYELWSSACEKYGLSCSREYGVKLEDATQADQYIGKWGDLVERKWGIDSEMTKSHIKKGREDGLTPFDFLRKVVEDGDLTYVSQFCEYALAMKGKTQLYWSRGLKARFVIEEKTDEQVAKAKEELADLLGRLSWQDWCYILEGDYRAKLLDDIEKYGYDEALERIGLNKNEKDAHIEN